MTDIQQTILITLLLILCVASIFALAYSRRKKRPVVELPPYPQIMEVTKLSDVPEHMKITGNLVYVTLGLGCKGLYIHNGTEFVKVENKVCPTCGK